MVKTLGKTLGIHFKTVRVKSIEEEMKETGITVNGIVCTIQKSGGYRLIKEASLPSEEAEDKK